jgi:class 3 adenylate cyclase/tetratricopeptide (TPR) repeat protein
MTPDSRTPLAPSGTVTFLFTDIEGSTLRWERNRAAMEEAVRLHDRLLRAVMVAHGGHVFKTVGDAFCVAFSLPEAAARAALDGQLELRAADFSAVDGVRVRMAIHTGTADERDGDYFGPAVNRVARLLGLAHGEQILLSAVAAGLVGANPPDGSSLVALGAHALKDIERDEHVHQLVASALRREFPALRSHKTVERPWTVPDAMRTRYFTGREELLTLVETQLLERGRAALCGLGGAGKTQAALEYARRHRARYAGGVFWLNAETTAGLTSGFVEIAKALRLADAAAGEPARVVHATLAWFEKNDRWLLIFDNVDERRAIAPFVPESGNGNILITSRESVFQELGIPRALEVRDLDAAEALEFLLVRTGRQDCDAVDRGAARDLAHELGNLPLALEQAAAYAAETGATFETYLRAFRKRRIALLDRSDGLLSRDTVSVTWAANFAAVEQASPESADALRISALFAPDAIPFEAFEGSPDADEMTMVELLRPLARYSLIRTETAARTFGVHRLVQEIVRSALGETERVRQLGRAVAALDAVFPDQQFKTWERAERLLPHVLALAGWIREYGAEPDGAPELLNKAGRYLAQRGRYPESEAISRGALALAERLGAEHPEVATSLGNIAIVLQRSGRYAEAQPLYERSLEIRERVLEPDHPSLAISNSNLGNLHYEKGNYQSAVAYWERSTGVFAKAYGEDHEGLATAIFNTARAYEKMGRYAEAQPLDERAFAIRQRALGGDHPHVALSLSSMANLETRRGNYAEAERLHEQSLHIRERALGRDHDEVGESLNELATLYVKQGRHDDARPLFERALAIHERSFGPEHPAAANSLHGLATMHLNEGRHADAERLFERALRARESALGPQHPDVAESLIGIAALHTARKRHGEAAVHLERALAIRERDLAPGHPELVEIRESIASARERELRS